MITKPLGRLLRLGVAAAALVGLSVTAGADGNDELIGQSTGAYHNLEDFVSGIGDSTLPNSVIPASGKNGESFEIDPDLSCEYDGTIFGYMKLAYFVPLKDDKIVPICDMVPVLGRGRLSECYREKVIKGGKYVRTQYKWKNQAKIGGKIDSKEFDGKTSVKISARARGNEKSMSPLNQRSLPSAVDRYDVTGGLSAGSMGKGKVSKETYADMSTVQRLQYLGVIKGQNREVDTQDFKKVEGELSTDLDDLGVMDGGKVKVTNKEPNFDKDKPGLFTTQAKGPFSTIRNTGLHWLPTSQISQFYNDTGCLFNPDWTVVHPFLMFSTHTASTKWQFDPTLAVW